MKHPVKTISTLLIFIWAALYSTDISAETAAQKGLRIAQEASSKERGYQDLSVSGEMILFSKDGRESLRRFDASWVSMGDGDGRSVLIFRWPGDIRNTALLTHSYVNKSDSQWLYMPSISRVRRIASSGRSGSFVGSEFSFEDMVDQEVEKYDFLFVGEEVCPGGGSCYILDRFPKFSSGYKRHRIWIDRRQMLLKKVDYYDRRDSVVKTLLLSGYKRLQGRYWRAHQLSMVNHRTKKSTQMNWTNFRFNTDLNAGDFSVRRLKKLR